MFSRFVNVLPIAALVAVAAAAPNALEARASCSGGSVYCCNQKFDSMTPFTGILGGLLTAIVGVGVQAGLTCDPISVIGVGGTSCTTQTACCVDNTQNGLVNVDCTPINVSA